MDSSEVQFLAKGLDAAGRGASYRRTYQQMLDKTREKLDTYRPQ